MGRELGEGVLPRPRDGADVGDRIRLDGLIENKNDVLILIEY
jgi:hypothetical protein